MQTLTSPRSLCFVNLVVQFILFLLAIRIVGLTRRIICIWKRNSLPFCVFCGLFAMFFASFDANSRHSGWLDRDCHAVRHARKVGNQTCEGIEIRRQVPGPHYEITGAVGTDLTGPITLPGSAVGVRRGYGCLGKGRFQIGKGDVKELQICRWALLPDWRRKRWRQPPPLE